MKIITWNCNLSFRTKAEKILIKNPDILIVPECENFDRLKFDVFTKLPNDQLWFGKNVNKGIGIFSYSDYTFEIINCYNSDHEFVIPILVSNTNYRFVLIAVWTQKPKTNDNYVVQIWNAIKNYEELLNGELDIIIAGDFNSNSIWDKPKREATHTNLVKLLAEKNIFSCYHTFKNESHGSESAPTLFMFRNQSKPYHIDYCFASENLKARLEKVEIGQFEEWTKYSDHKPLIVSFSQ